MSKKWERDRVTVSQSFKKKQSDVGAWVFGILIFLLVVGSIANGG